MFPKGWVSFVMTFQMVFLPQLKPSNLVGLQHLRQQPRAVLPKAIMRPDSWACHFLCGALLPSWLSSHVAKLPVNESFVTVFQMAGIISSSFHQLCCLDSGGVIFELNALSQVVTSSKLLRRHQIVKVMKALKFRYLVTQWYSFTCHHCFSHCSMCFSLHQRLTLVYLMPSLRYHHQVSTFRHLYFGPCLPSQYRKRLPYASL